MFYRIILPVLATMKFAFSANAADPQVERGKYLVDDRRL